MKKLELTGQSWKTVRDYYEMSEHDFNSCITPIKGKLDIMTNKKKYRNLLPKQVKLIIEHLEG